MNKYIFWILAVCLTGGGSLNVTVKQPIQLSKQDNETLRLEGNVNKENIEEIINAIGNRINKNNN